MFLASPRGPLQRNQNENGSNGRPHPFLLPQEKEQPLCIFGIADICPANSVAGIRVKRRMILPLRGERVGVREVVKHYSTPRRQDAKAGKNGEALFASPRRHSNGIKVRMVQTLALILAFSPEEKEQPSSVFRFASGRPANPVARIRVRR